MPSKASLALGALAAALALAGGTAAAATAHAAAPAATAHAAAPAATAHAAAPVAGQLTLTVQLAALQFVTATGPLTGPPTAPLVPGDRIIGQDRVLRGGTLVGHDNEACSVSFNSDVLCQDILILDGQGDVQTSWTFRWPAIGSPASWDGIIDGGTGIFRAAHGWFHAQAQPGGDTTITATLNGDN
jgi:hypothetical protein